jgi:tight adherence protein B
VNVLVSGLVAGAVMFVLMLVPTSVAQRRSIKRRVAAHVEPRRESRPEHPGVRGRLERPFAATQARLDGTQLWASLAQLVDRAGIALRPVEVLYAGVAGVLLVLFLGLGAGVPPLVALLAAVLASAVARLLLGIRITRRLCAFEEQLPEVLGSIASALRAGHSFTQALTAVAAEAEEPARREFGRVLAETRLGRPVDEALADLGRRMGSRELDFVLTAVSIQRQVGGSIAGLFETVAETVRVRRQFARKLRALTAMGRASAAVLIALPFLLGLVLTMLNPSYMSPLYGTATGRTMLGAAVASMAIGTLWLRKIVAFRG